MINRWLSRALVVSFLVNVLLAVWLWSASRQPEDALIATRDFHRTRVVRDSARTIRVNAVDNYSNARRVLVITDTVEVERVLTLADSAIAAGERSEAAADTALARADTLIAALRKNTKPKLLQPWAEALYSPYSREYVGRLGVDANLSRRLSLVAATEIRQGGPGFAVGVRYRF